MTFLEGESHIVISFDLIHFCLVNNFTLEIIRLFMEENCHYGANIINIAVDS